MRTPPGTLGELLLAEPSDHFGGHGTAIVARTQLESLVDDGAGFESHLLDNLLVSGFCGTPTDSFDGAYNEREDVLLLLAWNRRILAHS